MDLLYLAIAALVIWALCGAVMWLGPPRWGMTTAVRVHLVMAPVFSFCISLIHAWIAPGFDPLIRALSITTIIIVLDAGLAAPVFQKSYDMFRSPLGTWIPFVLIFLASRGAGALLS